LLRSLSYSSFTIDSNIDKFIESFPEKYKGYESDNKIIKDYLSKMQLTKNQSEKMKIVFEILRKSEDTEI